MVNKGLLFPRNVDGVISSAYSLEISADEPFADEPDFANERPMVKNIAQLRMANSANNG